MNRCSRIAALPGKGEVKENPRREFFYFNDDGSLVALRYAQWKIVFAERTGIHRLRSVGRIEKTQPNIFSADETADVGIDNQTPVAEGIGVGPQTRFTGTIRNITLEVDAPVGRPLGEQ
jgi:hypothetical protein